jgi:methylthioribose-1-phosphate isomerase
VTEKTAAASTSTWSFPVRPLAWRGEVPGRLRWLDQRALPSDEVFVESNTPEAVYDAIRTLAIRGAPLIGVAAAYGVVLGAQSGRDPAKVAEKLRSARPTAVNLAWACARMTRAAKAARLGGQAGAAVARSLLREARRIEDEDREMCARIGANGAALLRDGDGVLTHCNAGALATAGIGTALGAIYAAHAAGKRLRVYADETRPLLQGARLTAWELRKAGVDVTLISDGMAGALLASGRVQRAIVGADRIARNGDAANKIGTYGVAVLAKESGVPFTVAAPSSTFDLSIASGKEIPIEERSPDEVRSFGARPTAPMDVPVWNPAFDVTPARYISGIVTERGVITPVSEETVARVMGAPA